MSEVVKRQYGTGLKIAAFLIVVVVTLALFELGARLIFHFKTEISAAVGTYMDLDPYEQPDPSEERNWVLRSSTEWSLSDLIRDKETRGAVLGVQQLREAAELYNLQDSDILFRINEQGFKGPELDFELGKTRILTIGDSCTFGTWLDKWSYPRSLESSLREMGQNVEVINAGVEGYSPKNVLYRIEEFKSLRPDIVTIYIGWNALYMEPLSQDGYSTLASAWLMRAVWKRLRAASETEQERALRMYGREKIPELHAPEMQSLNEYSPSFFDDVVQIVDQMQSAGSHVVLNNLPGLFTLDKVPSSRALEIGHLPPFTNNPYVLAKIAERYNLALRDLSRQSGAPLVDLDGWSRRSLQPRELYFTDSVHLTPEGQRMLGEELAQQLAGMPGLWD